MPEQNGALSANFGGGKDIAQGLAYGQGQQADLPSQLIGALASTLGPERSAETERQAFWAGLNQGTKGGTSGEAMGNALTAQVAARETQDKLKAAYIPLIMQSLTQQRANDIAYSRLAMDRQKEVNPIINSALYGLQANGQPVTKEQAHERINAVGATYGLAPHELYPHHIALHKGAGEDGANLQNYLQQLRVAASPAPEGLPKFAPNAAGQTTVQNAVAGTVGMPGQQAQGQGPGQGPGLGVNPSKTTVDMSHASRGDPKVYTEELGHVVRSYHDMLQRVNAIDKAMGEFTPGRYAGVAGGLARAVKDLTERFPGANSETISKFAQSLLGPGADPVAASQFAEALKTQEAIAQLKTSLDGAGRIGQSEFKLLNSNMPGNLTDPGAYTKFRAFVAGQGANALNKYKAWGEHVTKVPAEQLTVHGFDIPWEVNQGTQLQKGGYGALGTPTGETVAAPAQPRVPTATPGQPAATPARRPAADLSSFEPGAKVGPTGKIYVVENGVPRPARRLGAQPGGAQGGW